MSRAEFELSVDFVNIDIPESDKRHCASTLRQRP